MIHLDINEIILLENTTLIGSTTKVGSKNKMVYLCLHKYDHMDKDINQSLLELILPEGILEYFTTVGFDYKYAL